MGDVNFRLLIGEPPVGAQSVAINSPGSLVRTAQIRTLVTFTLGSVPAMGGLKLRVPIYIEAANSEARLTDIQCKSGTVTSVKVQTFPGLAELVVGDVDEKLFHQLRQQAARGSRHDGLCARRDNQRISTGGYQQHFGHVDGLQPRRYRYQQDQEGQRHHTDHVLHHEHHQTPESRREYRGCQHRHQAVNMYRSQVASTLSNLTLPMDRVLATYMFIYGYKIGEADVSVTGASCSAPSLVL